MTTLGIIGCANVVEKHIIKALLDVKNGKLSGIASRDVNKAKECASRFGCSYFDSYEALLKSNVDAVYVPLPVGLHEEWVIKAAKAGKHILCEKSLSGNLASVKNMIEVCKKNKVILFENFMCNYHPQHQKVISLLPEIGDAFLFNGFFGYPPPDKDNIRYNKELGGGSLNDVGCYPVFMSRKMFQSEPIAVTCKLVYDFGELNSNIEVEDAKVFNSPSSLNPQSPSKGFSDKKDVDTQGIALLEFPNNKFASIAFGFNNFYQNNYSVWGSKGLIKVERAYSIPADMKPQVMLIKQDIEEKIDIPAANHFTLIFEDFFKKIENNESKNFDYSSLIAQAKIMEALRISARDNRKVMLSEIK